jgi:hypothetical protein
VPERRGSAGAAARPGVWPSSVSFLSRTRRAYGSASSTLRSWRSGPRRCSTPVGRSWSCRRWRPSSPSIPCARAPGRRSCCGGARARNRRPRCTTALRDASTPGSSPRSPATSTNISNGYRQSAFANLRPGPTGRGPVGALDECPHDRGTGRRRWTSAGVAAVLLRVEHLPPGAGGTPTARPVPQLAGEEGAGSRLVAGGNRDDGLPGAGSHAVSPAKETRQPRSDDGPMTGTSAPVRRGPCNPALGR